MLSKKKKNTYIHMCVKKQNKNVNNYVNWFTLVSETPFRLM